MKEHPLQEQQYQLLIEDYVSYAALTDVSSELTFSVVTEPGDFILDVCCTNSDGKWHSGGRYSAGISLYSSQQPIHGMEGLVGSRDCVGQVQESYVLG